MSLTVIFRYDVVLMFCMTIWCCFTLSCCVLMAMLVVLCYRYVFFILKKLFVYKCISEFVNHNTVIRSSTHSSPDIFMCTAMQSLVNQESSRQHSWGFSVLVYCQFSCMDHNTGQSQRKPYTQDHPSAVSSHVSWH